MLLRHDHQVTTPAFASGPTAVSCAQAQSQSQPLNVNNEDIFEGEHQCMPRPCTLFGDGNISSKSSSASTNNEYHSIESASKTAKWCRSCKSAVALPLPDTIGPAAFEIVGCQKRRSPLHAASTNGCNHEEFDGKRRLGRTVQHDGSNQTTQGNPTFRNV